MLERQTPEQRFEYGRSLREKTPLESHAEWSPENRRADPVALIEEQNRDRIDWLVPERRSRMSQSAFTFILDQSTRETTETWVYENFERYQQCIADDLNVARADSGNDDFVPQRTIHRPPVAFPAA